MQELHPIAATVKKVVKKVVAEAGDEVLEDGSVQETVKVDREESNKESG